MKQTIDVLDLEGRPIGILAKNAIRETEPGVFSVTLTQGKVALVDRADLEVVAEHRWCANRVSNVWYAISNLYTHGRHSMLRMHRALKPMCELVDHINGDGLDCRNVNIRIATKTDNGRNSSKRRDCSSGFKGVGWNKECKRWQVRIVVAGHGRYMGLYDARDEAARAYDAAARASFGAFAALNFPEPGERSAR
jgi:hypothetical protein